MTTPSQKVTSIKIKCDMCAGLGETHEVTLPPDNPEEWWEPCQKCNKTGMVEISLLDYLKDWIITLIFKIKCIPYRLNYKQPIESEDIPF